MQLCERRPNGAALRMPQHAHQPGSESGNREFDAADLGRSHDVAGDANDEQITQSLIEYNLRGHPGIRATENDREGLLILRQFQAPCTVQPSVTAESGDESAIAFPQALDGFSCRSHRMGSAVRLTFMDGLRARELTLTGLPLARGTGSPRSVPRSLPPTLEAAIRCE